MFKRIMFPFDERDTINKKVEELESLIGADNVNRCGLELSVPSVSIRCTKKQWKEVKFKLDLVQYYIY